MLQLDEHALVNSLTVELRKEYANVTEYGVVTLSRLPLNSVCKYVQYVPIWPVC
jgi:hypothetical protein